MKSYKFFPKELPRLIVLFVLFYIFLATVLGVFFYKGNQSPKILNAVRFFPIPVAQVDSQLIWARKFIEYRSFMENFIARSSEAGQALDLERSLDKQVVDMLVQNFIIQRIADDFGIKVSSAEVDTAYKNLLVSENGEGPRSEISEDELKTILEELYGSDSSRLKEFIAITLLEEKIKNSVIEQVRFRHILVATKAEADKILGELQKDKSFSDLAKEFSKDSLTRDKGGEVDFVARVDIEDNALQTALFDKGDEAGSKIVQAKDGFHVIEVLEERGSISDTFADFVASYRDNFKIKVLVDVNN